MSASPPSNRAAAPPVAPRDGRVALIGCGLVGITVAATMGLAWIALGRQPGSVAWVTALSGIAVAASVALAGLAAVLLRRDREARAAEDRRRRMRRRSLLELLDRLPLPIALCHAHEPRALVNRALARSLGLDDERATTGAHVGGTRSSDAVGGAEVGPRLGAGADPERSFDWSHFVAPGHWPAWSEAVAQARSDGHPRWLRCAVNTAGTAQDMLFEITPVAGEDAIELVITMTPADGAAGRGREALLQLRELLERTEAEKWQFGQAVHDELGQRLSGIAYFAKALQRRLQEAQRAEADDAGWLTGLANESMTVARSLARGLVPVGGDDPEALASALAGLCETTRRSFGIECTLRIDPRFDVGGAAQAAHLYHAAQELLTNAIRHGQARRVELDAEVLGERQRVTVRDDGCGFGSAAAPPRFGMGLKGVRARAEFLGGRFAVGPDPSGGVRATIDLPPPRSAADDAESPPDGGASR